MRRLLPAAIALALGCTDAALQPVAIGESALDDRLAVRGRVCTGAPDPMNFPVKVDFLVDKSGSMCVSDPPGSQTDNTLCQNTASNHPNTVPGRVRALRDLIRRFYDQPNVFVALDPFESKIDSAFPDGKDGSYFVPPSRLTDSRIGALQANLGKGTDYQGALAQVYWRIESDILKTNAQLRPRTRYVVVLLTDGAPFPRCAVNDDMPAEAYATADQPWGIWRDNPADFFNANDAGQVIPGFVGGAERNQNYQIFDAVDRLLALKQKYNIGDIRLHTILLFNEAAAAECGEPCRTTLYNGLSPADARRAATWTLTQMAQVHGGGGSFQEFVDAASIELGALDYTSLASRFAAKTLLAENTNALPGREGVRLDSDGDGLGDDGDGKQVLGTERFIGDTDADGFSDGFEAAHRDRGFDPLVPDSRGCRTTEAIKARFSCADTDGDGLSQAAEAYLGTDETLLDSDADGLPDGAEAALGLDGLAPNDSILDTDLDGVPDALEVLHHTHPLLDDRATHAAEGYRYQLTPVTQADGSVCYDFAVSNIRLLSPAGENGKGQIGHNLITLSFGEAPEGSVARDYGVWKKACVFAQFAPPSLRDPPGPEIVLEPGDFHLPKDVVLENFPKFCKGALP